MSVGPTNLTGAAAAGTPLAQTRQDGERTAQQANNHQRAHQSQARAAEAAGIGQTAEDHEAADRDADGRRLWEEPAPPAQDPAGDTPRDPAGPRDPHGDCGTQLDISG